MDSDVKTVTAKPAGQRRVIRSTVRRNPIPDEIVHNEYLNEKMRQYLPTNYNFEMHKIIWKLREARVSRVALQFPEGLFIFSRAISEIITSFLGIQVIIMGDVTYGACCVDDFVAALNGCSFIVHFAHSCLVPVNLMSNSIKVMYVFVDIKFDVEHCLKTIVANFDETKSSKTALCSTIQFVTSIHGIAKELKEKQDYCIFIPTIKPLSPGEVLGCTSPKLDPSVSRVIFVSDGRFHLESVMIHNPHVEYFKYNPYSKEITRETYDFELMVSQREVAVKRAKESLSSGGTFGLILGTLGRQGSATVLKALEDRMKKYAPQCEYVKVLIPEITANILNSFEDTIDVWIQISCPRLSIDWGNNFVNKPLLTPYELNLALNAVKGVDEGGMKLSLRKDVSLYPMDFYATNSHGNWTPNHKCNETCSC